MTTDAAELRAQVQKRYATAAISVGSESSCGCDARCCSERSKEEGCCGDDCCQGGSPGEFGHALYREDQREQLPEDAVSASLGCGNPTLVAELRAGETVLDLGSGGGIDVILSARRVGPTGHVYGLDMANEMIDLARRNAAEARVENATFLTGLIEDIPLPDRSVDVVISNCVINLSTDKEAVIREMARVLKPGGRIGLSDVVADDHLTPEQRAERGSYVGCVAGALSASEYKTGLKRAGFEQVSVTCTHEVTDGIHGAVVQAGKPG